MSLVADEALHTAAFLAAVNASLPASVRAYSPDAVPEPLPQDYVEVTVSRRAGVANRANGRTLLGGWRATTRAVSSVGVYNAQRSEEKVRLGVEFKRLSVGGKTSTPVQFETSDAVGPDDGAWSGLSAWTYAL